MAGNGGRFGNLRRNALAVRLARACRRDGHMRKAIDISRAHFVRRGDILRVPVHNRQKGRDSTMRGRNGGLQMGGQGLPVFNDGRSAYNAPLSSPCGRKII